MLVRKALREKKVILVHREKKARSVLLVLKERWGLLAPKVMLVRKALKAKKAIPVHKVKKVTLVLRGSLDLRVRLVLKAKKVSPVL
jgi:hypothetical protein